MKDLYLRDILPLGEEEVCDAKIALNMSWDGKPHFQRWNESDADNRDVSYSYYSHYGSRRNFTRLNQLVFGFVQLPKSIMAVSLLSITLYYAELLIVT